MSSCEVSILLANVFELTSGGIYDLNIAGEVLVAPDFAEVVKAKRVRLKVVAPSNKRQKLTVHMQSQTHRVHGCLNKN